MQLITFDIMDRCNLRCAACLQSAQPGSHRQMGLDLCRRMMDHAVSAFGVTDVAPFNWGEPLLVRDLPEYLRLFAAHGGLTVALSSNMTVSLPEERIAEILPLVRNFRFSVSGWTQEVYGQYHRGGHIDRVKAHIGRFLEVRAATGAATRFDLLFGRHLRNAADEEALRDYCAANGIHFRPARYYITSLQAIDGLLRGDSIDPGYWNLFYPSEEAAREAVRRRLTPGVCRFLYEVVADVDGNLMTCCGDKISLPVPLTEVPSVEALPALRLRHPFCRRCFELGLSGYFEPSPDKRGYSERPPLRAAVSLGNADLAQWGDALPLHWQTNRPGAVARAHAADAGEAAALSPPETGYVNLFQYVEVPADMAGAMIRFSARCRAGAADTLMVKLHAECDGQWTARQSTAHPGDGAWHVLEACLTLPDHFVGGRVKVEAVHFGAATEPCAVAGFSLTAERG